MKIMILFGLACFVWVSIVALLWVVRVIINGQVPTSVTVLLLGVGLIGLGALARRSGWCRINRAVSDSKR